MKNKQYGLIGYPLSHSFSPGYFAKKFERLGLSDHRYDLYPLEDISQFTDISDVAGLNVTIPYKEQVIPYLDELSDDAKAIGAVNTIKFDGDRRVGYNSDVYGFEQSLIKLWSSAAPPSRGLILGTGGAAKAVRFVLERLDIAYQQVSRSAGDFTYDDLPEEVISTHHLIINTTPLGMSPKVDECPAISYGALTSDHILYDLVYNPAKTLFLRRGEEQGATIKNGLEMLELQAEKSWSIWTSEDL